MGGASSWYSIMCITGFLTAVWLAGRVSKKIGMSSIVLEVGVGLVLGPSVAGLIPKELSECFDARTTTCTERKFQEVIARKGTEYCDLEAYVKADKYSSSGWNHGFWGAPSSGIDGIDLKNYHSGSAVVVLDGKSYCVDPSGAACRRRMLEEEEVASDLKHGEPRRLKSDKKGKTDYDTYDECLKQGCQLDLATKCALTPDIFTMIGHTGVAMMIFESGMHFDFEQAKTVGPWASAVAVLGTFLPLVSGAALAVAFGFDFFPDAMSAGTSLAPTSVGIALRLLHEAKALQEYFGQAVMTAAFVDDVLSLILFSVLFSLGGEITFMTFLPLILGCVFMVVAVVACVVLWPPFMKWLFAKIPDSKVGKVSMHDQVMWILMFVTLAAYAQITHLCGTHLWGCFIGGMCFSTMHHAHHVWVRQVKRITVWFMRIFFAATLAWSIPVKELFSLEAFWKGTLMGIGPCVATKVFCGPFMGDARWVIGWAMVGRAEFAYFIAIMAKALKMMEDKLFAILIWALIYATIFAPLLFSRVLKRYMQKLKPELTDEITKNGMQLSGHLPDLEEEEEAKKKEEEKVHMEQLEHDTEDKDSTIQKLQDEIKQLKTDTDAEIQKLQDDLKRSPMEGMASDNGEREI